MMEQDGHTPFYRRTHGRRVIRIGAFVLWFLGVWGICRYFSLPFVHLADLLGHDPDFWLFFVVHALPLGLGGWLLVRTQVSILRPLRVGAFLAISVALGTVYLLSLPGLTSTPPGCRLDMARAESEMSAIGVSPLGSQRIVVWLFDRPYKGRIGATVWVDGSPAHGFVLMKACANSAHGSAVPERWVLILSTGPNSLSSAMVSLDLFGSRASITVRRGGADSDVLSNSWWRHRERSVMEAGVQRRRVLGSISERWIEMPDWCNMVVVNSAERRVATMEVEQSSLANEIP